MCPHSGGLRCENLQPHLDLTLGQYLLQLTLPFRYANLKVMILPGTRILKGPKESSLVPKQTSDGLVGIQFSEIIQLKLAYFESLNSSKDKYRKKGYLT